VRSSRRGYENTTPSGSKTSHFAVLNLIRELELPFSSGESRMSQIAARGFDWREGVRALRLSDLALNLVVRF
jgi:hypothetical protein